MSTTLALVIERLSTDAAFRALVERDPRVALAEYALDPDEQEALASGDRRPAQPLGVDARIAKWASAQTNTVEQDAAIEWLKQWWN
jgi:hypothetical protein